MSQRFTEPTVASDYLWYSHSCTNYRASSDNAQFVKAIEVGTEIKYRAGFKIYNALNNNPLVNGSSTKLFSYTITENSATVLVASLVTVAAAVMHVTF